MTAKWVAAALLVMAPVSAQYTAAPYSAVETSEVTKTLLNGTNITQTFRWQLLYRDSHGRTRTEILPVIPYFSAAPPAASGPASPTSTVYRLYGDRDASLHRTAAEANPIARESEKLPTQKPAAL
jgi:hypothetical protein